MITKEEATLFAREWTSAWNSHNLQKVLSHYTDDFIMESPMANVRMPETQGIVAGKTAVATYWQQALAAIPNLHFEIIEVLTGISGITIFYLNTATGKKTAEVLYFNDAGLVYKAYAYYN